MFQIPPTEIERVLTEVVNRFLIPKFIDLGMNATGDWINALEVRVNENTGEIWGLDYTEFLVNGRPPNKNQDKKALAKFAVGMFYKNESYKRWLSARGLNEYGIQIAYKIAKEGTSYYPSGTDLLEVLESNDVSNYIYKELGGVMAGQLRAMIVRDMKKAFA